MVPEGAVVESHFGNGAATGYEQGFWQKLNWEVQAVCFMMAAVWCLFCICCILRAHIYIYSEICWGLNTGRSCCVVTVLNTTPLRLYLAMSRDRSVPHQANQALSQPFWGTAINMCISSWLLHRSGSADAFSPFNLKSFNSLKVMD